MKCPYCNEKINEESFRCDSCGYPISTKEKVELLRQKNASFHFGYALLTLLVPLIGYNSYKKWSCNKMKLEKKYFIFSISGISFWFFLFIILFILLFYKIVINYQVI